MSIREQLLSILNYPVSSRTAADPVLPLRDAAAIAGCHPDTLKNQAKRGKLTLLRISQRRLGIRQSEFERYLNAGAISYEPRG